MSSLPVVQLIIIPHRPVHADEEIRPELNEPFKILLSANGLRAAWEGEKFEERDTKVLILLWSDLESSHAFFTSAAYDSFNNSIKPALMGRKVTWTQHARVGTTHLNDEKCLESVVRSPGIEVAWTKVVEGKVVGYYEQFDRVIRPILNAAQETDGFFVSPHIENPQNQALFINWDSVKAHVDFMKTDPFQKCIDALWDYYGEFVVPWHIVKLKKVFG